jgi:RNA binding exosome subunit
MTEDSDTTAPKLTLDLDAFFGDEYIYTTYDIGHAGHSVTILTENKEAFIEAFVDEIRERLNQQLEDVHDDIDED